jgi:hypothetical protein
VSTPLSDFYEPLRYLLGDYDADVRVYTDSALAGALRSVVYLNGLPGYSVTLDRASVTPSVANVDGNAYALLVYKTAQLFAVREGDSYEYRTRALQERFGGAKELIWHLSETIYKLEHGGMFAGWQQFTGWWEGMFGLNLTALLTAVEVDAPASTLHISTSGTTVDSEEAEGTGAFDALFTQVGPVALGDVLLGEYIAPGSCLIQTAVLNCRAPAAEVQIALRVNGAVEPAHTFTLAAGVSRISAALARALIAGDAVRWVCTAAPAMAADSASEVSINLTIEPQ